MGGRHPDADATALVGGGQRRYRAACNNGSPSPISAPDKYCGEQVQAPALAPRER
jgi:hypothetical protein